MGLMCHNFTGFCDLYNKLLDVLWRNWLAPQMVFGRCRFESYEYSNVKQVCVQKDDSCVCCSVRGHGTVQVSRSDLSGAYL